MPDNNQSPEDQDVARVCASISALLVELAERYGSIRPARVACEHALRDVRRALPQLAE